MCDIQMMYRYPVVFDLIPPPSIRNPHRSHSTNPRDYNPTGWRKCDVLNLSTHAHALKGTGLSLK